MKKVATIHTRTPTKASGIVHIATLLAIGVFLFVVASGYAVYRHNYAKDTNGLSRSYKSAIKNAKCLVADADLCKFFTAWKLSRQYTAQATITSGTTASTATFVADGTDKFHITATGYEMIGIGTTVYARNAAGDLWWQQKVEQKYIAKFKGGNDYTFTEPQVSSTALQPSYLASGTEKCGDLTCLKYQVTDPLAPNKLQFIWFDTVAYRLQRLRTTQGGITNDCDFTYTSTSITDPSPTQEVSANQIVLPGTNEPTTLPSAAAIPNALDSPSP
ncbi:MAG TPA: hypothetical protein VMY99_03510 [Nevskiaceae bacterium]|nr:hypothetical protein [Nevskiaceae bacterium]